ncbi:MAG: hypothetical protein EU549_03455 [Promethearchaeota archaeon]|nr:MAG: hypothetical protein EU549_03455 [Candidatus Lokiarchaeota archaeon]
MKQQFIQDCELEVLNTPLSLILTRNKYAIDFKIKNVGNIASKMLLKFQYENIKCQIPENEFNLNVNNEREFSIKVQPLKSGLQVLSIKVIGLIKKRIKSYVEVPNPNYVKKNDVMGIGDQNNLSAPQIDSNIPKTIKKEVIDEKVVENLLTIKNIYLNVIDSTTAPKEINDFINIGGDANPIGENIQSHLCNVLFYNPELTQTDGGKQLQFLREMFFRIKGMRKEPFYYITFPIDQGYSKEDSKLVQNAINFFIKNQLPSNINKLNIFNLSYMEPFTNKSTIILGRDKQNQYSKIESKIKNKFKDTIDVIIDADTFSYGRLYEDLKKATNNMNINLVNCIFTTDLIENRNLLLNLLNLFQ